MCVIDLLSTPLILGVLVVFKICEFQSSYQITIILVYTPVEKLEVFIREDGERGVRALTEFTEGQFVCEFEANLLTKEECEKAEQEYERDGKAVYILQVSICS